MEPMPPSPTPPAPAPAATAMQPPKAESEAPEAVAVAESPVAPETEPSVAEVDAPPSAAAVDEPQEIVETSAPVVEQDSELQEAQIELSVAEEVSPVLPEPSAPAPEAEAPMRRARWFRGQFPVVTFEDGSSQVMQSLDALKDLLRSRGLNASPSRRRVDAPVAGAEPAWVDCGTGGRVAAIGSTATTVRIPQTSPAVMPLPSVAFVPTRLPPDNSRSEFLLSRQQRMRASQTTGMA